jgi:hypothetical protein
MAETKQGLEIAVSLIHKGSFNHQSETLTLSVSDGDNANGVATQSTAALSPYPVAWYDAIVDRYVGSNTVPVFMQPMGNDVDSITGPNQFVYDTVTKKIHVSDYSASDTYKITFRDSNGGVWSLIQYERQANSQQNENVRPVHQWNGSITHFKKGIFAATQSIDMLLSDPFDNQNMLLIGERYDVVVNEPIPTESFTSHDATGDPDVWVADLELDCASNAWSRVVFEDGTVGVSVASIALITAVGKYFIDTSTGKIYVGVVNGGNPLDILVSYRCATVYGTQEFMMKLDVYAEDGSTVEFTTLFPKACVFDISCSNPDTEDCTVTANFGSCGLPVTV